jgi:hypothetical protein
MASMFNPDTFTNMTTEAGFDTRRSPVPEGEHVATVKGFKFRQDKEFVILDIAWRIDNQALAESMGLKEAVVNQGVFLDIDANGKLEKGANKNIQLGRVLLALGQNSGPWSPQMLTGAGPVKLQIIHEPDKKDATIIYDRIKAVTAMAA